MLSRKMDFLQTLSDDFLIGGIHSVHLYYIKAVALLVGLHHRQEAVPEMCIRDRI